MRLVAIENREPKIENTLEQKLQSDGEPFARDARDRGPRPVPSWRALTRARENKSTAEYLPSKGRQTPPRPSEILRFLLRKIAGISLRATNSHGEFFTLRIYSRPEFFRANYPVWNFRGGVLEHIHFSGE
jgi:hypothetical protein